MWLKLSNNPDVNQKLHENALCFAEIEAHCIESRCEELAKKSLLTRARAIVRAKAKLREKQIQLANDYPYDKYAYIPQIIRDALRD